LGRPDPENVREHGWPPGKPYDDSIILRRTMQHGRGQE